MFLVIIVIMMNIMFYILIEDVILIVSWVFDFGFFICFILKV